MRESHQRILLEIALADLKLGTLNLKLRVR